jgi:tRNA threonylcarbamoyl adenosine modification protein YeaZ
MLILGVDTSGKGGSIALVKFEGENARTLESVPLEGGTFSAQLVPQISDALNHRRLSKPDIDAFAVASGPGSFTGLRVGLAAIKALAEVLQKPIAAVSLLEAVVPNSGVQGDVVVAQMGNDYGEAEEHDEEDAARDQEQRQRGIRNAGAGGDEIENPAGAGQQQHRRSREQPAHRILHANVGAPDGDQNHHDEDDAQDRGDV